MFELDAYLERIALSGRPSIAEVHRAHLTTIPFEALDPYRGISVSLGLEDIERKLVRDGRGGYCFEQNLLLKAALEALGAEVEPLLARPLVQAAPGETRPRTHLLLRVRAEGSEWLADVGFGIGSPLEPLPFRVGEVRSQAGWRFRIVEADAELVLQNAGDDGDWTDLYSFLPQAAPFVDLETSNWYTSTHPRSPFVTSVVVGIQAGDGRREMLRDWDGLAIRTETPAGSTRTAVEWASLPELLADRFRLPGFTVGANGELRRS
jgi:N-hydroxyarylamine O-acetyltransferase